MILERLTYLLNMIDPNFNNNNNNNNNNDNNNNNNNNNDNNNNKNNQNVNDNDILGKDKKQNERKFTKQTTEEDLRKKQIDEKWKKELSAWSNL